MITNWQEHVDYEINAQYDYIREANVGMEDTVDGDEHLQYWVADMEEALDAMEARGGPVFKVHVPCADFDPWG